MPEIEQSSVELSIKDGWVCRQWVDEQGEQHNYFSFSVLEEEDSVIIVDPYNEFPFSFFDDYLFNLEDTERVFTALGQAIKYYKSQKEESK
jgi:hypothetical protein